MDCFSGEEALLGQEGLKVTELCLQSSILTPHQNSVDSLSESDQGEMFL